MNLQILLIEDFALNLAIADQLVFPIPKYLVDFVCIGVCTASTALGINLLVDFVEFEELNAGIVSKWAS